MTKTETGGAFPAWRIEPFLAIGSSVERFQIVDGNSRTVMVSSFRERADFIVTAVNAYEPGRARIAELTKALRETQAALAMMIAPDAIKNTTTAIAFATAVSAEAKPRAVLEKRHAD